MVFWAVKGNTGVGHLWWFNYPGLLLLSENLFCHSTAVEVYLCPVLRDLSHLSAELPGSSVSSEHSCLDSGELWV